MMISAQPGWAVSRCSALLVSLEKTAWHMGQRIASHALRGKVISSSIAIRFCMGGSTRQLCLQYPTIVASHPPFVIAGKYLVIKDVAGIFWNLVERDGQRHVTHDTARCSPPTYDARRLSRQRTGHRW